MPAVDGAIEPVPKSELDAVTVELDGGGALAEVDPGGAPNAVKVGLMPPVKVNGAGCCVLSAGATEPLGLNALLGAEERLPKVELVDAGPPPKKGGIAEPVDAAVVVDGPNTDDPSPNLGSAGEPELKAGRDTSFLSA